jgi:hypothetical protein
VMGQPMAARGLNLSVAAVVCNDADEFRCIPHANAWIVAANGQPG